MSENNSKQILVSILGVAILVVALVGVSFAAFTYSKTGTKVNTVTTGTITMSYSEPTNGIALTDALPMTDDSGKKLTGTNNTFDFTVTSTVQGTATINYAITASIDSASSSLNSGIKVYLTSGDDSKVVLAPTLISNLTPTASNEASGAPTGQFVLVSGSTKTSTTTSYRLRMWVADTYTNTSTKQSYKLRVNVYGKANAQ